MIVHLATVSLSNKECCDETNTLFPDGFAPVHPHSFVAGKFEKPV